MTTLKTTKEQEIQKPTMVFKGNSSDSVYGLGFIGALVYYMRRAKSFQDGVVGFIKAIVWPAILVYEIFKLLKIDQPLEKTEPQDPNI